MSLAFIDLRALAVPLIARPRFADTVVMAIRQAGNEKRRRSIRAHAKPYMFVSRTPDGRCRTEVFTSAAAYRSRLSASLSKARPISLNELIDVLDIVGSGPTF
jgi:hypothetical protein